MNGNKERKAFCQSSMTRDIQNKMIKIIEILESDAQSFDFLEPVDYIALEINDYPSIITRPMDLGTIKSKIRNCAYEKVQDMLNDVQLVWDNCKTYNMTKSDIYQMAIHCEKVFKKQIEKAFNINLMKTNELDNIEQEEVLSMCEKMDLKEKIEKATFKQLKAIVKYLKSECIDALEEVSNETLQIKIDYITRSVLSIINYIIDDENRIE